MFLLLTWAFLYSNACPDGATRSSAGICYISGGNRERTYGRAEAYCNERGFIVATLETEDEFNGVLEMLEECMCICLSSVLYFDGAAYFLYVSQNGRQKSEKVRL